MLRFTRKFDSARRRRIYRQIEHEKKRLIDSGVDAELVRLCCRSKANLKNQAARSRFEDYDRQMKLFS